MLPYLLSGPANTKDEGTAGVYWYFDRDLSWLSFNDRVLMEAEKPHIPLLERIAFLAIFSSNLDEFYRVRMPAIAAVHRLYKKDKITAEQQQEYQDTAKAAVQIISAQLDRYGATLRGLIQDLRNKGVHIVYNEPIPDIVRPQLLHYFYSQVLAYIKPIYTKEAEDFEPGNNELYMAIEAEGEPGERELILLKLPTENLPRFFSAEAEDIQYILFLDDVIRLWVASKEGFDTNHCYTFKVTRDAELHLDDIYEADIAAKIEKQISKRDFGLATRLLHEPDMPEHMVQQIAELLGLKNAMLVAGGRYHALKDLSSLPLKRKELKYPDWAPAWLSVAEGQSLLDRIMLQDVLLHPPYDSYDTVLRFFNEAAINPAVAHIFLTVYRVAPDSKIINALLSAAHNGKAVTVVVELKARFDEANNIKWAKQLKRAGVEVHYTDERIKVHAKIALVKFKPGSTPKKYAGLLATGNLNESTARFYTDHILLTANETMLTEVEQLFGYFSGDEKVGKKSFQHLLVPPFNLQQRFIALIDREIAAKKEGRPAGITIKLNNLEERVLINKLYEASTAGVPVRMIVRGICCLVPGLPGQSEQITIRRIVDRYLEHGRVFIFENAGAPEVYMGSADWMNRNIYHRIEVCFPIMDEALKAQMMEIIAIQLQDNVAAVAIVEGDMNQPVVEGDVPIRSQEQIYELVNAVH